MFFPAHPPGMDISMPQRAAGLIDLDVAQKQKDRQRLSFASLFECR